MDDKTSNSEKRYEQSLIHNDYSDFFIISKKKEKAIWWENARREMSNLRELLDWWRKQRYYIHWIV